jgi:hypothetical protein
VIAEMASVPYVFTVAEMIEHFIDAGEPTPDDLVTAMLRLGRNYGPALLADIYTENLLTAESAARGVPHAWSMCEFPERQLDHGFWRRLFDVAGYTVDEAPAERPAAATRLYRGATADRRHGWSWTDDLGIAQRFATGGLGGRPRGRVWVAVVTPGRILARIHESSRRESECVVDARGLAVRPHLPPSPAADDKATT